jgi:hypothetical protein
VLYKFKPKTKRIDRDEKLKDENMRRRPLDNETDEHRVNRDGSNVELKGIEVRTAGKRSGGKGLETGRFDDNTRGKE